jgi:hypothetical protein
MRQPFAALAGVLVVAALAAPAAKADPFKLIVTETETPLVPNSVADLAIGLGYYKRAGVDVELVRVQQTPSAVAALRSGEGDMANIAIDTALQLVGRDQMKLKGVVSPDKALPFLIAAKKSIAMPQDLNGKIFGVARVGSADYTLSRVVLGKLGVEVDGLQYLSIGQRRVRSMRPRSRSASGCRCPTRAASRRWSISRRSTSSRPSSRSSTSSPRTSPKRSRRRSRRWCAASSRRRAISPRTRRSGSKP